MNKIVLHIIFPLIAWTLISCSSKDAEKLSLNKPAIDEKGIKIFNNKQDLVSWNENSDELNKEKEIAGFNYKARLISPDLLALKELKNIPNYTTQQYQEALSHYTDLYYISLNITNPSFNQELLKYNLKDANEYKTRTLYCSFHIQEDLYLTNHIDTIPCVLAEFERTYEAGKGLKFTLAFPKFNSKANSNYEIMYHDELFQNGIIKIGFDKEALEELPKLNIK